MTNSSRFVPIIVLGVLVLLGAGLWWSLRSERLAQTATPSDSNQGVVRVTPLRTSVQVGSEDAGVQFLASEAELSTSVQNQPDFEPLPTRCEPLQNVASYAGISELQAESVYVWDLATATSENEQKLAALMSLGEELNSLTELADPDSGRLPLRSDWVTRTYFPWIDTNCLPQTFSFYPLLVEEATVEGADRAWYIESIDVSGQVQLPVTRRLVLNTGTRWVMVSELSSSTKELGIAPETVSERLETTCRPDQDSQADVVSCAAQIWFGEYRQPEVAAEWVSEISSRLEW